ncbi:MAG: hypothetical protein HMLKMBBP_00547 [Planctomycetes bacterium]|nr:hypothetical protein [Planctomycetota bacterium]
MYVSARSDDLRPLRELLLSFHATTGAALVELRVATFVVDTNYVLGELHFLLVKAKTPGARTALQELIGSGTARVLAPRNLRDEVEEHLPTLCKKWDVDPKAAKRLWKAYRADVTFCKPHKLPVAETEALRKLRERDPDDVPFRALHLAAGTDGILSKDGDLRATGDDVRSVRFVIDLRDYARHKAVEVQLWMGTHAIAVASVAALAAVVSLVVMLVELFMRSPPDVQLLILIAIVLAILNPRIRAAIQRRLAEFGARLSDVFSFMADLFAQTHQQALEARERAAAAWQPEAGSARRPRDIPAIQDAAYCIAAAARRRVSTEEIAARLAVEGYELPSNNRAAWLADVLRTDRRFSRWLWRWRARGA